MGLKDKESIIKTKQNEIVDKKLERYYGKLGDSDVDYEISSAYEGSEDSSMVSIEELEDALELTKVPRYVRLAKFLRKIDALSKLNVSEMQARILLRDEKNQYDYLNKNRVNTIYKEFKKIEKRKHKLSKDKVKKLNRFKDVKNFYNNDLNSLRRKLKKSGIFINKFITSSVSKLTEFFDSCDELNFLYGSKLTRKVR